MDRGRSYCSTLCITHTNIIFLLTVSLFYFLFFRSRSPSGWSYCNCNMSKLLSSIITDRFISPRKFDLDRSSAVLTNYNAIEYIFERILSIHFPCVFDKCLYCKIRIPKICERSCTTQTLSGTYKIRMCE